MAEERKIYEFPLSLCFSGKCDRHCSHCIASATMNGCFFTPENAMLLARAINRSTFALRKIDLRYFFHFTGDGELLLNPQMIEIFDLLFGLCPNITGGIVTSGINPKSPEEKERLLTLLSRPYVDRIKFAISFNLFEKHFPKRVIKTLDLLFRNGVSKATIKLCLPGNDVYEPIRKLNWLIISYFIKWVREIDPLALEEEAFWSTDLHTQLDNMIDRLCGVNPIEKPDGNIIDAVNAFAIDVRVPTRKSLRMLEVIFQVGHKEVFGFKTKYGTKKIAYLPHFMTKRGRATELKDEGWPPDRHRWPCCYLREDKNNMHPHIATDGYYYPDVNCPRAPSLRLSHIRDNIRHMYYYFQQFRKPLLKAIISDATWYNDICDHCVWISKKLTILPKKYRESF